MLAETVRAPSRIGRAQEIRQCEHDGRIALEFLAGIINGHQHGRLLEEVVVEDPKGVGRRHRDKFAARFADVLFQ